MESRQSSFENSKITGVIRLVHKTSARPQEHNITHNRLLGRDACSRDDVILEPLQ